MEIPQTVQNSFFINVIGEIVSLDESGLKERESIDDFYSLACNANEDIRLDHWWETIIDFTWEIVDNRCDVQEEDFDLAVKMFNEWPLDKQNEVMEMYSLFGPKLTDTHKAYEVFKIWFSEMYERTVKAISN